MTLQEFQQFAASRGYKCSHSQAFGMHQGYPFTAHFNSSGRGSIRAEFKLEGQVDRAFFNQMKQSLPTGCSAVAGQACQVNLACVVGRGEDLGAQLVRCLDTVTQSLRQVGAAVPATCPICKRPGCDCLALLDGYVPTHQACVEKKMHETISKAEENSLNGNYVTGCLGALLGGLIGAIPAVLMRDFGNYLVAVLYALIPLGANFGYKLLKGKRNYAAFGATIFFSILDMFLVRFGMFFFTIYTKRHMIPSIGDYFDSYGAMQIGPDLLFLALGIWFAWGAIKRTTQSEAQEATLIMHTVQPLQPR